jgi:hypothetical protein
MSGQAALAAHPAAQVVLAQYAANVRGTTNPGNAVMLTVTEHGGAVLGNRLAEPG